MKRLLSLIFAVCMVLLLVSCGSDNNDQFFDAEVLEIYENSILVRPTGGKDPLSAQQVVVTTKISGTNPLPKLEKGTQIRVMFGGDVKETEPAQIDIVFAIYRLDEIQTS